ncbi:retrovirus-related Pol polyprotein from transposon 17.6 [Trichonephila clavipes]|nr:retrovirus-related Pol polyprotein from transposon 17.6 [Trichonephila clavipes]
MALYRSPLTVTLWPSSFLKKYGPMIPPAHKAHQTVSFSGFPSAEKNDKALDRVSLDYLSKKQQTQLKDGEHVIKLKNEEETMKRKTYKIPENLKRKVDVQIDELLELELIEPVVSEIAHTREYDGVEFLSREEKFITVLDMLKGYWSIPMEDISKHLTAFRTHRGHYQWNVLPFGLRNAAATY